MTKMQNALRAGAATLLASSLIFTSFQTFAENLDADWWSTTDIATVTDTPSVTIIADAETEKSSTQLGESQAIVISENNSDWANETLTASMATPTPDIACGGTSGRVIYSTENVVSQCILPNGTVQTVPAINEGTADDPNGTRYSWPCYHLDGNGNFTCATLKCNPGYIPSNTGCVPRPPDVTCGGTSGQIIGSHEAVVSECIFPNGTTQTVPALNEGAAGISNATSYSWQCYHLDDNGSYTCRTWQCNSGYSYINGSCSPDAIPPRSSPVPTRPPVPTRSPSVSYEESYKIQSSFYEEFPDIDSWGNL